MIQTENLTKIYKNGFKAVNSLNLQVAEGDIFGFLGPNGAGKTTTIRMLDGLLKPTEGIVKISGMDIKLHELEIKRIIGVVPESHGYYYSMTAREYLEYFSSLFDAKKDNSKYITYLLDQVGLSEKGNVIIGQFSRGMKQRLGIAKSLINKPKIIFLDEPTLGLDPLGQHEIQQLLLDINKTERITIFITSHLLKDVEVMCNKISIIKNGTLIEQGTISELKNKYMTQNTLYLSTNENMRAKSLLNKLNTIEGINFNENERMEVKLKKYLSELEINKAKHDILNILFSAGIDITEMSQKTINIEDIFFLATELERE